MSPMSFLPKRGACAAVLCALLGLAGCGAPIYQPEPGTPLTTAKVYGFGMPHMCKDGKVYRLEPTKNEEGATVQLPVGKRILLSSFISASGYQTITTCNPRLSVVPQSGVTLAIHSGLANRGGCFIEAVREDASTDTGVAVETSLGAPSC